MIETKKRPDFKTFKNESLKDKNFKAEYESLRPEFERIEQSVNEEKAMSKHTTVDRINLALAGNDDPRSVMLALTDVLAHWVASYGNIDGKCSLDVCTELLNVKVKSYRQVFEFLERAEEKEDD
jgi:hypothetical protein